MSLKEVVWKLLSEGTLASGLVAVMLVATACYCAIAQVPLPDYMGLALGSVLGFFFGSGVATAAARANSAS